MEQHLNAIAQLRKGLGSLGDVLSQIESQTVRTSRTVHWAAKGAVADFDRLDRLNFGGGGSSTLTVTTELSEGLLELKRLLGSLDFTPVLSGLTALAQGVSLAAREGRNGLSPLWENTLQPLAQWTADGVTAALGRLQTAFAGLAQTGRTGLSPLWENVLRPMEQWTGQHLAGGIQTLIAQVGALEQKTQGLSGSLRGAAQAALEVQSQGGLLQGVLGGLSALTQALGGAVDGVSGKLSGLYPAFQTAGNAAIGAANTVFSGIEGAVNAMSIALKALAIDIPSWVPVVGGKKLSIDLGSVALPRIPQLARGAVLPANKPFLAMVGDQRNGTNIEAPLETIQEALANVLGASLPGQQAANELLAQILTAIEGITVGDDTIGRAARRYEQQMAMLGGVL